MSRHRDVRATHGPVEGRGETNHKAGLAGLLTAGALSLLGSRMTMVALPWLVLVTTGSAAKTGIVGALELLPYVLACALGGPLIDRVGGRRISIAADVLSVPAIGAIPLLYDSGSLSFPALLGLVAVAGLLRGMGDTAKHGAMFPQVVAQSGTEMTRAASLVNGLSRGASLVGVMLAGALVVWFGGAANVLLFDAASFALCALLIGLFVRVSGKGEEPQEHGPYFQALRTGVAFVRKDKLILGIVVMLVATNTLDQAMGSVLIPLWAREIFGSAAGISVWGGSFGLGAVVGNVVFAILAPRLARWSVYAIGFLIGGAPRFIFFAFGAPGWAVVILGLISGVAIAAVNPILSAVSYERIPESLQARVQGLVSALAFAGLPLGALVGGWLGGYGVRSALLITGFCYLLATLLPFFGKVWREMDIRPPAVVATQRQPQDEEIGATVA